MEEAGLPKDIQPIGFRERRWAAPAGSVGAPPTRSTLARVGAVNKGSTSGNSTGDDQNVAVGEDELYDRVAEHTGVDRGRLEQESFHLDEGSVSVSLRGLRLGSDIMRRTRVVAQILRDRAGVRA